jgi:hypothetical protein
MIITNIKGGLGNQMFQYAFGKATSLRLDAELNISADQYLSKSVHNGFELDKVFNLNLKIIKKNDLKKYGYPAQYYLRKIYSEFPILLRNTSKIFLEKNLKNYPIFDGEVKSIYLEGYWQSENYFKEYSKDIRENFTFPEKISTQNLNLIQRIESHPSIGIHVRRGDYLLKKNRKTLNILEREYYHKAIDILLNKYPKSYIYIFSDDAIWAKENIKKFYENTLIIDHNKYNNSFEDMRLMSLVKNNIISNSTFSWWGAWLNQSPDKIVIAPKKWYKNKNSGAIVPSSWIQL